MQCSNNVIQMPQSKCPEFIAPDEEQLNKVNEQLQAMLKAIADQEAQCLLTIHSRYCLIKGFEINVADVSRYQPDKKLRPNYWEFWYKWNKPEQYFLMSRDVEVDASANAHLFIAFNKELAREGE